MNFNFKFAVMALMGLFGLILGHFGALQFRKWAGGKQSNTCPTSHLGNPQHRTILLTSTQSPKFHPPGFHRCTTRWCGKNISGQDPLSRCFQCLSPTHDRNVCGPCLTSGSAAQQCRAIQVVCGIWNPGIDGSSSL